MGSASFYEVVKTTDDLRSSFDSARERVQWNNEGDGDNNSGTIAGSFGVQKHPSRRPVTLSEAYVIANRDIRSFGKSDNCRAVELVADKSVKERKLVKKLKITAKAIEEAGSLAAAVTAAAKASVTLREGEFFDTIKVVIENGKEKLTKKYKVTVETVEGKAEIRYFVRLAKTSASFNYDSSFKWEDGFKSMSEARKTLIRYAETGFGTSYGGKDSATYEVVAHTMRENGNPLLQAVRQVVGADVEVEVKVVKIDANPARGGWLFFGWTHE